MQRWLFALTLHITTPGRSFGLGDGYLGALRYTMNPMYLEKSDFFGVETRADRERRRCGLDSRMSISD